MRRRWFSFLPPLTFRGRTFKGLRGWAGKPLHPPLTDVPVGAYVLVAVFDLISFLLGGETRVARDAYLAGTWTITAGAVVSVATALTGFWDWLRSTPRYSQAWRTANTHMAIMVAMTVLVIVDIVLRLDAYDAEVVPGAVLVLSLLVGAMVTVGGTYGGTLTYDYGFNVETATDSPVWHESERDLYPGERPASTD